MIDDELVHAHRDARAVARASGHPRHGAESRRLLPGARGGNPFYLACPGIVQTEMDRFATLSGRHYRLFDYVGRADASASS